MSEFEQMLDESFKTIRKGEVVEGTVISVRDNDVVVNIGYKHDALLAKTELTKDPEADIHELIHEGDPIKARVLSVNDGGGLVVLTMQKMFREKISQVLQDAFDNHTPVTATVDEVVNKGITATVDEVKVFIPASLVNDPFEKDLTKYVGQEITMYILAYEPRKHRVVGDRKSLILEEREAALKNILDNIHEGDIVEGTVKNVTDFGAFIDLGGADGLLHISEMSWGHIGNPKKAFKSGDTIRAFVKSIDGKKIGLSRKFPDENPWADAEKKFAVDTVVTGKVARLTDFGAFINLADGVDGLLHVSQITQERIEKPSDVLTLGQEVTAKITQLDLDAKRISLSIRAMLPKPERKPRNTRAPREEENTENADGTLNIAKYIAKLDREEAKKEAAEKAKALKDSIEEKAFEAGVAIEEKVTEEKAKVAEAVADIKEAAEEKVEAIKEAAVEKAEEVQEAVAEKVEEIKEAIEEKKDEA